MGTEAHMARTSAPDSDTDLKRPSNPLLTATECDVSITKSQHVNQEPCVGVGTCGCLIPALPVYRRVEKCFRVAQVIAYKQILDQTQ